MVSTKQFQFITIQHPDEAKDRTSMRMARSHAVARGLEIKRKHQQNSGHNFRVTSLEENSTPRTTKRPQPLSTPSSTRAVNHSHTPATESQVLQTLLSYRNIFSSTQNHNLHRTSDTDNHSSEPVFSISDELVLHNFHSVLREGVEDQTLRTAVKLTFAFALTAGSVNKEFLKYQSEAMSSIRQRMSFPDRAISESTLGTILLLAGIEARLGMPHHVQIHMGAIRHLLDVCQRKQIFLSDAIKRAIIWQDLNTSVMTGSTRVVDHTTFPELIWIRDPSYPKFFIVPTGFQPLSHLLGQDFVEILKDIYALQCIRDCLFGTEEVISMAKIDNHQISIQSRLVGLPKDCVAGEACHLAAYLCAAMLRCKRWRTSTIPSYLSQQLLCKLQQAVDDPIWDQYPELLAWLLYLGGAFAPSTSIRENYAVLLKENGDSRFKGLFSSWEDLLEILKGFVWSEKAFLAQVRAFWEESSLRVGCDEL